MVDEGLGIRVSVLVSGILSCIGSFCLIMLLLWWFYSLSIIRNTGSNVSIRSTLCRFILQLAICDFFTACAYIASFFVKTFEVEWYCLTEATIMIIFEYGSLLWTCSIAYLMWRISILCAPRERWDKEDFTRAMKGLKLTEVVSTLVSWLGPLVLVLVLGATNLLGSKKDGYWCWITDITDRGWWIQLLCFYFPLWMMTLFCIIMLLLHYRNFRDYKNILKSILLTKDPDFLEQCTTNERDEINQRVEDFRRSRSLIVWFVISFLFLWTWVSLSYALGLFDLKVYPMEIMKYLCAPLQGFVNFLVYGVIYLEFPFCAWKGWRRYYYVDIPNSSM